MPRKTVEFEATVIAVTDKALLVDIDGDEQWIPFSQVSNDSDLGENSEVGDTGVLIISEWIAQQKDLI